MMYNIGSYCDKILRCLWHGMGAVTPNVVVVFTSSRLSPVARGLSPVACRVLPAFV